MLLSPETQSLIKVLSDYTNALDILDDYDHERITFKKSKRKASYKMNYSDAQKIIKKMREKFGVSGLFGRESNRSLEGSIAAIYPSVEEKAAHLLYFVVKNHPFVDGNKRIGAVMFLWFMERNGILYDSLHRQRLTTPRLLH